MRPVAVPGGRTGVDVLARADQDGVGLSHPIERLQSANQAAGEAVDLGDGDALGLTRLASAQCLLESWTVELATGLFQVGDPVDDDVTVRRCVGRDPLALNVRRDE
jgi:hypothetical protein